MVRKNVEQRNSRNKKNKREGKPHPINSIIDGCMGSLVNSNGATRIISASLMYKDSTTKVSLQNVDGDGRYVHEQQLKLQNKQHEVQKLAVEFCSIYYSNGCLKYEGCILKASEAQSKGCPMSKNCGENDDASLKSEEEITVLKQIVKHGHGVHIDRNGNRYEGGFKYNKRHGWGNYTFYPSGNTYRGEFYEGTFHGYGTHVWKVVIRETQRYTTCCHSSNVLCRQRRNRSCEYPKRSDDPNACIRTLNDIYQGEWQNNQMYGYGIKTLHNGDSYEGYWKENAAHGWGKKLFVSSGESHEGMYEKDKRQGYGIYTWSNGDTYEGEWYQGMRHGRGIQRFANCDDKYEGDFEYDVAQGYGCKSFGSTGSHNLFNEREYVGDFHNNVRHGYGTFTWDNLWHVRTTVYVGNWYDSDMEGQGVLTIHQWDSIAPYRPMYDGEFSNDGTPHGIGTMRYSNGDTYTGNFKNGLRSGRGSYVWHNNGNSVRGIFEENLLCGPYAMFDDNGIELFRARRCHGNWIVRRSEHSEAGTGDIQDGFEDIASEGRYDDDEYDMFETDNVDNIHDEGGSCVEAINCCDDNKDNNHLGQRCKLKSKYIRCSYQLRRRIKGRRGRRR